MRRGGKDVTNIPRVAISHSVTLKDHTSEAEVNSLFTIDSMAIHFHGFQEVDLYSS